MRVTIIFKVVAIVLLLACCIGCNKNDSDACDNPEHVVAWVGQGGGFQYWRTSGEYVYGVSVSPVMLDVWKWDRGILKHYKKFQISQADVVWLSDDKYVSDVYVAGENSYISLTEVKTKKVLQKWLPPKGWYCSKTGGSSNGKYAALLFKEDSAYPPPGHDWERARIKIGLIGPNSLELKWVGMVEGKDSGQNMRSIIPSNDGKFVAVAGWHNGVVVVDVAKKKTLWEKRPKQAVSLGYVIFAPDSEVLYTGGGEGCVYEMEVRTGKILSRWFASQSGKSEYGHRISAIAISPDGKYIAAGTGPEGLAYVFDRKTGKRVTTLNHGGSTILIVSFSPDSKSLATFAVGKIKIWKLEK
ncbi:MAG: WD40 repeat domain-containing protein [Phycisphaerae bacterium]|nr:WD40 repeat domain-containing protein [Phycisphaerae bacterium]